MRSLGIEQIRRSFLNTLMMISVIIGNSVLFLLLGHWITSKAYRRNSNIFKSASGLAKKKNVKKDIKMDSASVVPEWGKE